VDADVLMESLFRLTDLESRVSLNLNVLDADRTPRVMGLKEVLTRWLAFLILDRVIHIIRTEDEPKPVMVAEFALSDRQAEAILNMRLRSLRKLEEMQLKGERDDLVKEREGLQILIESE